jgi:hypothetical protein
MAKAEAVVEDAEAHRRPLNIAALIPPRVRSRGSMASEKLFIVARISPFAGLPQVSTASTFPINDFRTLSQTTGGPSPFYFWL